MAFMGPSGCGRSNLLHLLGGLDHSSAGGVSIDSTVIANMKDDG
jgi:ABC-type lipoprotein export system ATPase subunit